MRWKPTIASGWPIWRSAASWTNCAASRVRPSGRCASRSNGSSFNRRSISIPTSRSWRAALDELLPEPGYVSQEDKDRIALAQGRRRWLQSVRKALSDRDAVAVADLFAAKPAGGDDSARTIGEAAGLTPDRATPRGDPAARGIDLWRRPQAGRRHERHRDRPGRCCRPISTGRASSRCADRLSIVASIRRAATSNPPDYARLGRMLAGGA